MWGSRHGHILNIALQITVQENLLSSKLVSLIKEKKKNVIDWAIFHSVLTALLALYFN